jgi:tRNA nucleotidyltransferase/poly(A) polymerase
VPGKNLYEKLTSDPVWGPECATVSELKGCSDARPAVVGGAVRDLILERPISDLDIATAIPDTARMLAKSFAEATGRSLVEYTHKQTIYRVVGHAQPQVDFTDPIGGTREADLKRRDFTINAMALGLMGKQKGVLDDPMSGLDDLNSGIIRMTSPQTFDDDPLRLLRAFRFAAQLRFEIDSATFREIESRPLKLRDIPGERIQLELLETLIPHGAAAQIEKMDFAGIIRTLFPELVLQKNLEQNDYHHLDVWEHTLESISQLERVLDIEEEVLKPWEEKITEYIDFEYSSGHSRRSLMKLAMLLHDIAKPHCRGRREDGRITFIGHERLGSDYCRDYLDRLRFPRYERNYVCGLIEGHLRPAVFSREEPTRPRAAYRFFRDYEDAALGIILMSLADRLAAQGPKVTEEINERHRGAVAYLLECLFDRTELVVRPPQLVDGVTLMHELDIEPGPLVGHLLRRVQEAQVTGNVTTEEEALEYCRKIVTLSDFD